jgi:glycosyltransferase involved in cell wall biosynthesis
METTKISNSKKVLIALISLRAEGTPILVLEMCRFWQNTGIQPVIVTLNSDPKDLQTEFQELNIPIYCLNLPTNGYRRYFQMVKEIYRYSKITEANAFLSMPLGWHTFMAYGAYLAGIKNIAAHVGTYPVYWSKSFYKFRLQIQLGRPVVQNLICCSDYVRQGVIKHFGLKPSETVKIYNGCPVQTIYECANLYRKNRREKEWRIGMVASLETSKDQPTLIRSARLLKERSPSISFQIQLIGNGTQYSAYQSLIKTEQVQNYVQLLGTRRDIYNLLGQMDIFVFSVKPEEGHGVALVEAMCAELPIIATSVPATREVLEEGKLGTLIPPQDPEAMAQAIEKVINNPEIITNKVKKAREKAFKEFTIEKMAKQYARCLKILE